MIMIIICTTIGQDTCPWPMASMCTEMCIYTCTHIWTHTKTYEIKQFKCKKIKIILYKNKLSV